MSKNKDGSPRWQKTVREEKTTTIDSETGEILHETKIVAKSKEVEPPFVKLYINDIIKLNDLGKAESIVLNSLVKNLQYGNIVVLIKAIKEIIAEETGYSTASIKKAIVNLSKAGILIPKERSVYIVDPKLFARGKWEDVKKLRMTITYQADGTKTIDSDLYKQFKLDL